MRLGTVPEPEGSGRSGTIRFGAEPRRPECSGGRAQERWTLQRGHVDAARLHGRSAPDTDVARELRAVVLLAGQVGRSALRDGVRRSVLDLPVASGRTLLDVWAANLAGVIRRFELPRVHVRVAVDPNGAAPTLPSSTRYPGVVFDIVRDSDEYRGTAGVVKDLTADLAPEDRVLVAAAAQYVWEPLADVVDALAQAPEAVSVVPFGTGEFAGAFLLRVGRFADVPSVGFVDLKEQALPAARRGGALAVSRRPRGASLPVRTRDEFVAALRAVHGGGVATGAFAANPFAETWEPRFAIVEPGAHVSPSAVLHDSVVLAGGRVEAGAVVVRSVVCPGAVVRKGRRALETVVAEGARG